MKGWEDQRSLPGRREHPAEIPIIELSQGKVNSVEEIVPCAFEEREFTESAGKG